MIAGLQCFRLGAEQPSEIAKIMHDPDGHFFFPERFILKAIGIAWKWPGLLTYSEVYTAQNNHGGVLF